MCENDLRDRAYWDIRQALKKLYRDMDEGYELSIPAFAKRLVVAHEDLMSETGNPLGVREVE